MTLVLVAVFCSITLGACWPSWRLPRCSEAFHPRRINRNDGRSVRDSNRRYRDRKDFAIEATRLIKSKHRHSKVEVKDLQSGDVTAVALRPR